MKTYEEMAKDALERVEQIETEKKRKRKAVTRIAAPAVSLCLVGVLSIGVWKAGWLEARIPAAEPGTDGPEEVDVPAEKPVETEPEKIREPGPEPSDPEQNAVEAEPQETEDSGSSETTEPETKPSETEPEKEPLTGKQTEVPSADPAEPEEGIIVYDFSGHGEVPSADPAEPEESGFCTFYWNKRNVSGALKLALDSDPEQVLPVLATYKPTVDKATDFEYQGKTLEEWGEEAYATYPDIPEEAWKAYAEAYAACQEETLPSFVTLLTESGYDCEPAAGVPGGLVLRITADQLKELPLDPAGGWFFDLVQYH